MLRKFSCRYILKKIIVYPSTCLNFISYCTKVMLFPIKFIVKLALLLLRLTKSKLEIVL